MSMPYDFEGWATKNDLVCADGLTIKKDAFKVNDGKTVPLVWNHQHNKVSDVDTLDKIAREKIYLVDDYLKACKNLNIRYVISKDGLIDLDFKKVIESNKSFESELGLDDVKEFFLALEEYVKRKK